MARAAEELHWADYVVFAGLLLVSLVIGVVFACTGGKQRTQAEYFLGDRALQILPTSVSLIASFISAVLFLGAPAEVYTRGTMYWWYGVGVAGSVVFSALIFVPLLYPLKLTSSYEYLHRRYNSIAVKIIGDLLLILSQILYMGIVIFSPAIALAAVTKFPVYATILLVGGVGTLYTTVGGIKAVVWTDVIQAGVMVLGIIGIIAVGTYESGGIVHVWNVSVRGGRVDVWNFDPDPTVRHTFWSMVVGGCITYLSNYGVNQTSVQRYCAIPSLKKAQIVVWLNIIWIIFIMSICVYLGLMVYAYFDDVLGCSPLAHKELRSPNQLMPYFVMKVLGYPGVVGLFMAILFSGSLSTISSSLSAISAVVWEDMVKPCAKHHSEKVQVAITKIIAFLFGGVAIAMAFAAEQMAGTVLQAALAFQGAAGAPLLGLFLLGGLFPCANWIGAVIGAVCGLALPMWMAIGQYVVTPYVPLLEFNVANCTGEVVDIPAGVQGLFGLADLYKVSYAWFPAIGTCTCVVVGLIFSCLTGCTDPDDVDAELIIPAADWLCCCLRGKSRRLTRFNKPKRKIGKYLAQETKQPPFSLSGNGYANDAFTPNTRL